MLESAASLLIPLALSAGLATEPAAPSLHHDVKAYVTGYNTVAGQTDSTPCIAASGANICGRHDAVACPRRIDLGTVIEIRGSTYVCEDRLAKKFDNRFDISCDKDTNCPPQVTGWVTIKVYGEERPQPAVAVTSAEPPRRNGIAAVKLAHSLAHNRVPQHAPAPATSTLAALHPELAKAAAKTFPAARPQLAAATANFIARTSAHPAIGHAATAHLAVSISKPVAILRGRTRT